MGRPNADPSHNCTAAALLAVLLLLVLAYAAYAARGRGRGPGPRGSGFLGSFAYAPSCGAMWPGCRRSGCRGITSGVMPSIETDGIGGCGLCCGRLGGVPP